MGKAACLYTLCGIPMSIGAQMIAHGQVRGSGVMAPELAFEPSAVFTELAERGIIIHKKIEYTAAYGA